MPKTSIEWTDFSWPVINGCRRISPGCGYPGGATCYAERLAATRLRHTAPYAALAEMKGHGPQWTGEVNLVEHILDLPLRMREPQRIFVCDMGDLFYDAVPDHWIAAVLSVCVLACHHTFQILTKRPDRMLAFFERYSLDACFGIAAASGLPIESSARTSRRVSVAMMARGRDPLTWPTTWPQPHIWLGTSVEAQPEADRRRGAMERLAALGWLTWVSYEPALAPVDWTPWLAFIRWLVAGGASGPKADPAHPQWFRGARDACQAAGVAFLFKQWGAWAPDGVDFVAHDHPTQVGTIERLQSSDGEYAVAWTRQAGRVSEGIQLRRVGKKAAGRLLDGREWNEFPEGAC